MLQIKSATYSNLYSAGLAFLNLTLNKRVLKMAFKMAFKMILNLIYPLL